VETISDQYEGDLRLVRITNSDERDTMNDIRRVVFVIEQNVDPDIEFDEFEETAIHYLLYKGNKAIGCSRYRWSGDQIKLERYAILEQERGKGYGRFIMKIMMKIVLPLDPSMIYLHAQTVAKGFYRKFGFLETGEIFKEADIDHIMMYYQPSE